MITTLGPIPIMATGEELKRILSSGINQSVQVEKDGQKIWIMGHGIAAVMEGPMSNLLVPTGPVDTSGLIH